MARLLVTLALAALAPAAATSSASLAAARRVITAKSLEAAGLPDPKCSTGVISLKSGDEPQVCCAGYCGECSNYPTCEAVRGQDSKLACCATPVYEQRCGGGAAANVCLKKCSESVPPCIMDDMTYVAPDPDMRHAGEDCNKAVKDWRLKAEAATNPPQ